MMAYEHARAAAKRVRKERFGNFEGKLNFQMVRTLAESFGAQVRVASLDPGVSGFIIKYAGSRPRIYISDTDSPARQLFTLAHELGHLLERRDVSRDDEYSFMDYRKAGNVNLREFYANEFAGELLMPAKPFTKAWEAGGAAAAADLFGVSRPAAEERHRRLTVHPDD